MADQRRDTDVLIVGAGPSGLCLAIELARRGVGYRIIDAAPSAVKETRAIGIQARTMELFQRLGVKEEILERGRYCYGMRLYAGGRLLTEARYATDAAESVFSFTVLLSQRETEAVLCRRLEALGGEVERGKAFVRFTEGASGITATLTADGRSEVVRAGWIVGCDGGKSAVRRFLNVPFEGSTYEFSFLLADLVIDWDIPQDRMCLCPTDRGVVSAFPYPEPGKWRLVSTEGGELGTDPEAAIAFFTQKLRSAGLEPRALREPTWITEYKIHRRIVRRYRVGRCLLAGDAAHLHSPAGGQGLNAGIMDAVNLGWKLALVAQGRAEARLLDSYEEERRPAALRILNGSDRATRFLAAERPLARKARDLALQVLGRVSLIRDRFGGRLALAASQLTVSYEGSSIVSEDWPAPPRGGVLRRLARRADRAEILPGRRIPNVAVSVDGERRAMLHDHLDHLRHTLLLFAPAAAGAHEHLASARALQRRFGADLLAVRVILEAPDPTLEIEPEERIMDPRKTIAVRFSAEPGSCFIVRPDGVLGYRGASLDAGRVAAFLRDKEYVWPAMAAEHADEQRIQQADAGAPVGISLDTAERT